LPDLDYARKLNRERKRYRDSLCLTPCPACGRTRLVPITASGRLCPGCVNKRRGVERRRRVSNPEFTPYFWSLVNCSNREECWN